jgi:gliding motility-associated-like protein
MKHFSTKNSGIIKAAFIVLLMIFAGVKSANACHGVALLNIVQTNTGTSMTLNGDSDPQTCGCGPYYLEVEVTCQPTFAGSPYASETNPLWNTSGQPYYHSILGIPGYAPPWTDQCVLEPYTTLTVPFANLCPGTLYHWRYREHPMTGTPSGWFNLTDFTTSGSPPASVLVATSDLLSTGNPQYSGCAGDLFQFDANVSGGCPGATYQFQWSPTTGLSNPNIANPVCTLSTNITYTVTTSGGCFTITTADDTVQLALGPTPVAGTATAFPGSLCSGQSSLVVLTGQGAGSIQWEVSTNGVNWFNIPGATDDTLNTGPIGATLFFHAIVTGTGWPTGSGCGSSVSPPVMVTVNQSPTANAGANQQVCAGGCTNLTGTGGVTYTWQPGNLSGATVNVCPPGNTTYTLYIVDANGCSDSDMVQVNISIPSVTASPSVSICNGNSTVIVASGPAGQTYSWQPAGTLTGATTANPTANPSSTTTYTVTATNQFGCTAIDSVVVQVTSAPPIVASQDTSLCNGGAATLGASGATTYTWSPGNLTGDTIVVSPVNTTTYVVTGNTNNCISTDTVVVNVAPPLAVYAGPDFDVCSGTQVTLNVGVSGGTYTWTPSGSIIGSNTTQSVIASPTGTTSYTVNVTDANGCVSADTITITVNPLPNIQATSPDQSICVGQSTFVNGSGGASYMWTPTVGLTSPNLSSTAANPTSTTTYTVTGLDANGCAQSDTITIFVTPNPLSYFTTVATECGDTSGSIANLGTSGTPPYTYTIGSTTVTMPVTGLPAGTYTVTTTDANGCTTSNTEFVYITNTAGVAASVSPSFGTYPLVTGFGATGTSGVNNYSWQFPGGTPATASGQNPSGITYSSPGVYMAIVTAWNDDPACATYDTVYITVVEQATIALPNIFTPNNDASNDFFSATISGVSDIDVQVFNRWGALVYSGKQSSLAATPQVIDLWDGKDGSSVASDGVYYYIVTAIGYDQNVYPMSGFVHLISAKQ